MKKCIKIIIVMLIILAIILSINVLSVFAVSNSDLNDIQQKINETTSKIDSVEHQLTNTLTQIQTLNAQIAEYENEISDLNEKITNLDAQITESEAQIKKAEEDYKYQQELLQKRLVALYKAGNTTYLDVLLSSKDIVDFISKYYYISEIAEYDQNLLATIEENRKSIESAKSALEASKEQMEALKKNKEDTANALIQSKSVKQSYANQLTDEEKGLEQDLEQFEKDKKEIQAELERIARSNSSSGTTVVAGEPSEAGYIFPVAGLNIYNINRRYYPSYPGHTGVDININVTGKSVVAVKDGTVVISTALKNSDGSYRSYGEYIVIDHHDGTMTLYAHMYPGSRRVSVGANVVQGQVIGTVGTTGNSTGNHLHFEVRINGRCVNPLPYLQ